MYIRQATREDLAAVTALYAAARDYMRENGNPHQWGDGYPPKALICQDIAENVCYVAEEDGQIIGVFCYFEGIEPTYTHIEEGEWLNGRPYGVLHRIAVSAHRRGVASACFDFCFGRCGNLKIDTHRDNIPMQRSLAKNGFTYCGIIRLENGEERLAYQKANLAVDEKKH